MSKTATGTLVSLYKNQGHFRLYIILSGFWIAGTTLLLWGPLPGPAVIDGPFGERVIAVCKDVFLDNGECVRQQHEIAAILGFLGRAATVLLPPILIPLIAVLAATVFDWVSAGYRTSR